MQDASANIVNYGSTNGIQSTTPTSMNTDVTPRLYGRQILSGDIRGNQNITGTLTITNPNNNTPIIVLDGTKGSINIGSITNGSVTSGISIDSINEAITVANNGQTVITLGKDSNNDFNFRVVDTNGIGIGQFGQFPDGSVALKVAKSGIEVSTATNSQLIFNSNQDIFKIITTGLITIPQYTISGGATGSSNGTATIIASTFGLTGNELCIGYNYTQSNSEADPWTGDHLSLEGFGSGGALQIASFQTYTLAYGVTGNVATVSATSGGPVATGVTSLTFGPYTVKYFILQETVTS